MKTLIVFALILVGLFYGLQFGAGKVAEVAIEQMGSRSTGGTVTVDGVSISVLDGRIGIEGLDLSGIDGLGANDTVAIDGIDLKVEPNSLTGDAIAVQELIVEGANLNYTVPGGLGDLAPLLARLQQGGGLPKGLPGGGSGSGAGPQVNISNLQVTGGAMNIQIGDQTFSAPMPNIDMQNLGGSGGASAAALGQQVLAQIMANSSEAMAGLDMDALAKAAAAQSGSGMSGQMDAARQALDNLGGDAANTLRQLMNQ